MKVITIGREFAAGGHSVGKRVAELLGYEFIDKEIVIEACKICGMETKDMAKEEESFSRADSLLRAITPIGYDEKDAVFENERKAIIGIAQKQPCVILGRCAGSILEEAGIEHLAVFLHADEFVRAERAKEILGLEDVASARRAMRKTDTSRRKYFSYYSGQEWGDASAYDLTLNTGTLDYETCAKIIAAAAKAAEE